jgi:hypothetical protein
MFFTPVTLLQSENGVVTGRVVSADGKASAGVRVAAVPVPEAGRGVATEVLSAISQTDASGAYRLENLSPGRYHILAGLVDSPTYYLGATTPSEARVITVARNSVQSGIDFVLLRGVGVKLSGRVILDSRQQPSPELRRVMLARGAPFIAEAPVNEDGTFEFLRVTPGSYSVVIRGVAAVTRIEVGEKDVTGIELKVPLRYEVTARIVVERNGKFPNAPVGVFFEGSDRRGSQAQFLSEAPIKILFLEGIYRPMPNDIPQGYTVTSIKRGSLDMMKEPLKIPSDDTSEIIVTISSQP